MRQSDKEAERWWLKAGEGRGGTEEENEEWESAVRAQNTLGMFYSRQETLDFMKVSCVVFENSPNNHCQDVESYTSDIAWSLSLVPVVKGKQNSFSYSHSTGTRVLLTMVTWNPWVSQHHSTISSQSVT